VLVALLVVLLVAGAFLVRMPGPAHSGPLTPLTRQEAEVASSLRGWVTRLSVDIGVRSLERGESMTAAVSVVEEGLKATGLDVRAQRFQSEHGEAINLISEISGRRPELGVVILGAHYDTTLGTPGADDNASGVAALLELARLLGGEAPMDRTVRFVAFANEEQPYFYTDGMGSLAYARACLAAGDQIEAMISLETLGYFSDAPNSQKYPMGFGALYPDQGNFIGFVGNVHSVGLVRRSVEVFRRNSSFPAEGAALPEFVPGVGWSDHWAFWQLGVRAMMVTDTAPFRNPNYHQRSDLPHTLDFERSARVVVGLVSVVRDLATD
jgi:hypothetical protein